jgi:hypothetical protein
MTRRIAPQEQTNPMDSRQAKEILLRYRPGSNEPIDPQLAEALALAERDAELGHWLEQQQRADDAIRTRLREAPVPAGLKQRILAEHKIARVDFGWRNPAWLAAAAAVVILGAVCASVYWFRTSHGLAAYRTQMVRYITGGYSLTVKANNFDELRQVLAERKWPTDFIVPDRLRAVTVIGGGALEWKGHKVALACMREDRRGLWLFVISKAGLFGAPATETPRVQMVDVMPTATWSQGDNTYLLMVQGDEALLRQYLP